MLRRSFNVRFIRNQQIISQCLQVYWNPTQDSISKKVAELTNVLRDIEIYINIVARFLT